MFLPLLWLNHWIAALAALGLADWLSGGVELEGWGTYIGAAAILAGGLVVASLLVGLAAAALGPGVGAVSFIVEIPVMVGALLVCEWLFADFEIDGAGAWVLVVLILAFAFGIVSQGARRAMLE
jgi:hypothetical protein